MTYSTSPLSIGTETLPVKATCGSQCTFCAPTLIGEPSSAFLTPGISTKGGHTTRSTPSSGLSAWLSAWAKATASSGVLYIFQLPAMIGERIYLRSFGEFLRLVNEPVRRVRCLGY